MKTTPGYIRKMVYVDPVTDAQAISLIKERYGLSTDSDCIRLALRLVASSPVVVKAKRAQN